MKKFLFTLCLLLGAMIASAQTAKLSEAEKQEQYKQEVRSKLALDYSMPDYSTTKIDPNLMGPRLASILTSLCKNYQQQIYLGTLSLIQSSQIEGLNYGRVKELKLHKVEKQGKDLTILFDTFLEPNSLHMKKSTLRFHFVDGASENPTTNDFFCMICRYVK